MDKDNLDYGRKIWFTASSARFLISGAMKRHLYYLEIYGSIITSNEFQSHFETYDFPTNNRLRQTRNAFALSLKRILEKMRISCG